jgi:hypothetical protein
MKTAMQELIDNLKSIDINVPNGVKLIFIEKEKEQIMNAYEDGKENQRDSITNIYNYVIGEFYYNKTYKGGKQ